MPDIYKPKVDAYIELKGFMYKDAEEKIEMFRKEYPNIKLLVLMQSSKEWEETEKKYKNEIKEWEK